MKTVHGKSLLVILIAFLAAVILPADALAATKGQRITFPVLQSKMVGDPVFEIQASASSGLPVELTSSNPSVAEVVTTIGSTSSLRILKAGSTVITAKQSGNNQFSAAKDVKRSLVVKARPEGYSQAVAFAPSDFNAGITIGGSPGYDYESDDDGLAFTAQKRDTFFFARAPYISREAQYSLIYVDGTLRSAVTFFRDRLNRPFGYILEEAPWRMLEGKLKLGRVDLYTTLKPFSQWKEVLRAGTYNPEAQDSENPKLPLFEDSGSNTLTSALSHVKGDLFYFSRVSTTPPQTLYSSEIRVKGTLRGSIQWPPQLEGSNFGFRRAGTGAHTKGPEKTATLQDGQVLNFDF